MERHRPSKTLFDFVFSLILILFFAPLMLVIALAVKCFDGGSILFSQERVGIDEKLFSIYKFRSMSEAIEGDTRQVTASGDKRITPIGKILRRTKLDEMLQLFNILKGDMSFVGPRPEVPRYVAHYSEVEKRLLKVKPGLTDWASVQFRNEEEMLAGQSDPESFYLKTILPRKLKLSLDYLERATFWSDLGILWMTIIPSRADVEEKLKA